MGEKLPRMMIAGLAGDSGKTIASLSLLSGLRQKGLAISVFKKGPDYIDAAWLSNVAGTTCRNLDTYMVDEDHVCSRFFKQARGTDIAVVEGNRGLFDGFDFRGTHSSATLAKLLGTPVVLVVDATKATRTLAAMVKGCQAMDRDLSIAGVILNRVGGKRHARVASEAIEHYCAVPVVGVIPRFETNEPLIPDRHLGLVPPAEADGHRELHQRLLAIANDHLDLEQLMTLASQAAPVADPLSVAIETTSAEVKIGYFRDSVFTFYYPENLEALAAAGAEMVPLSALEDSALPDDLDGFYIGGGFPETQAERLLANRSLMDNIKSAAAAGLPIYAECGGLIYLSRSLSWGDRTFPMAGVLPIDLRMSPKPVGHGYVELIVDKDNPFLPQGRKIRGHEFHYSGPIADIPESLTALALTRGTGLGNRRDGLIIDRVMATYTHLHADGIAEWAENMVGTCQEYSSQRKRGSRRDQTESGRMRQMA